MVAEYVGDQASLNVAQNRADLILLVRLLEVKGYLGRNLRQNRGLHTRVARLLKEEVLSVSQGHVAIHR